MADAILLRVLTDAGVAMIDESAVSIIAPGERGYLGILRNHAPLVTTLAPGTLRWQRPDGSRQRMQVGAGLLEIVQNRCTVLTDSAAPVEPVSAHHGVL